MLHLYRRHRTTCPHRAWTYRRCQCPIYVKGSLGGTDVKKSLDLTSWEAAQKVVGQWTTAGKVGQVTDRDQSIEATVEAFLADAAVRGLAADTIKKYKVLLERRLVSWAAGQQRVGLASLDLHALSAFRATWPDAPLSKSKNSERLKAFFKWCHARGWITTNVASELSTIKVRHEPTLPYSQDEMAQILDACDRYPVFNNQGYDNRARLRAFILILRWSGLRIRDVVTLRRSAIEHGKLRLYTQKTGQHVHVPLPAVCLEAVERIASDQPYIFWTGNGLPKSAVADWQRSLRTLFALTTIERGHAHRFRDTFAVELLLSGAELADVSILLGHSSIRITERHYSPWVVARQRRLEEVVTRTWKEGVPA